MNSDSYYTIRHEAEGGYKELGSRFISFAIPSISENSVQENLENIHRKYHDATHHCYAYILGKDKKIFRAHDAGEPKHCAGDPILNQIRSMDITDVLIIVVRYFGGTKLGKNGLINAYRAAARSALENAGRVEKIRSIHIKIKFDLDKTGEIMKYFNMHKDMIADSRFEGMNIISLHVRESCELEFRSKLELIKGLTIL
jgi:uncharacterized YigZ family protein